VGSVSHHQLFFLEFEFFGGRRCFRGRDYVCGSVDALEFAAFDDRAGARRVFARQTNQPTNRPTKQPTIGIVSAAQTLANGQYFA